MLKVMIFPWVNRHELERVYQELYSDSVVRQKHALGRVAVWKSRAVHKLPVAVEGTAAFVAANLECRRSSTYTQEDKHLRGLYSFALMRFVNHITENRQTNTYAQPIHRLASELGMPEWVVELRHEATHGELPSLTVLRAAADWCLQWLKKEFWEVQLADFDEADDEATEETKEDQMVRDVLVDYQQYKYMCQQQNENIEDLQLKEDLDKICRDMGSTVCATLVETGYLVPSTDQLTMLGLTETDMLEGDLLLPESIVSFWRDILHIVIKRHLLTELLMNLVVTVTEEASLRNKLTLGWIYTIVWHSVKNGSKDSFMFKHKRSNKRLPYKQLLDICIQTPCQFSVPLIEMLLDQLDSGQLSDDHKQGIRQLMALYLNTGNQEHMDTEELQETSSDMETEGAQINIQYGQTDVTGRYKDVEGTKIDENQGTEHGIDDVCQAEKKSCSRWSRCTEPIVWSRYPLGVLPNQKLDYTCLELFTEEVEEVEEDTEDLGRTEDDDSSVSSYNNWDESTISIIAGHVQNEILGDKCMSRTITCS